MPAVSSTATPTSSPASASQVVVVDDDPHIAGALAAWLELLGLGIDPHTSAESLLQAWEDKPGGSQRALALAAIIDLNLPGMNGADLARRLKTYWPGLPMVIISGMRPQEAMRFGDLPPGVRSLCKPFDLDELEAALRLAGMPWPH